MGAVGCKAQAEAILLFAILFVPIGIMAAISCPRVAAAGSGIHAPVLLELVGRVDTRSERQVDTARAKRVSPATPAHTGRRDARHRSLQTKLQMRINLRSTQRQFAPTPHPHDPSAWEAMSSRPTPAPVGIASKASPPIPKMTNVRTLTMPAAGAATHVLAVLVGLNAARDGRADTESSVSILMPPRALEEGEQRPGFVSGHPARPLPAPLLKAPLLSAPR